MLFHRFPVEYQMDSQDCGPVSLKIILDFESKGTAEIITKRKRLIERLFDNLKAKSEE